MGEIKRNPVQTTDEFIDRVETNTAFLSCAVEALSLLHETLERNLHIREEYSGGMGYNLRVCSAMVSALRELGRINEELNAAVVAVYEQKKGET